MTSGEIAIWSGSMGVFMACFITALLNAAFTRSLAGVQAALFILAASGFLATCSGLLAVFLPQLSPYALNVLVLVSGPIAAAASSLGLIEFLRTHQRDAIVQRGMWAVLLISASSVLSVFWPNYTQALETVALVISACALVAFWLVLRAALLGDRFAWPMAIACVAMLVAVMALYGVALRAIDKNLELQALGSAAAATYLVGCAVAVWRRNTEFLRMRKALSMHREKDLLTQLWTGAALVKRVDKTIARARRNRKETAIICVQIFNSHQLRQEMGNNAVEQVVFSLAARIRQSVGSSTEVGRYDDSSFVVIIESVEKSSLLRSLGLRIASAVRKPFILNPYSTSPRDFQADVGIGIARLPAGKDVRTANRSTVGADTSFGFDSMGLAQEAMHEASELAKKARAFNSRAAIMDAYSRKTVPLENADLR
jgi:diguanylate cyclase (GGDEF)-like protein